MKKIVLFIKRIMEMTPNEAYSNKIQEKKEDE
jgi:hypothetical protein